MDIEKFQEKLAEICEIGEKNGKVLKPEQIKACFGELDLDKSQLIKILQYLKLKGISIEGTEGFVASSQAAEEASLHAGEEEKEKKVPLTPEEEAYLKEYLEAPFVHAVGGSWLCPKKEIAVGNFDAITALCREASEIVREVRG